MFIRPFDFKKELYHLDLKMDVIGSLINGSMIYYCIILDTMRSCAHVHNVHPSFKIYPNVKILSGRSYV